MWNPIELSFKRFMSYEEQTISFSSQTYIIYGENKYDRGQKTNGSGKSAPLEALVIAITGRPLREGVSTVDFIRDDCEDTEISFKMENIKTKDVVEISRKFYTKTTKSQEISINKNGKPVEIVDPNHANNLIIEYLGIEKEDLLNYYLISKDKYKGFFSSGDAGKKSVISRFANITLVDPVFEKIKQKISDIDTLYRSEENLLNNEQGRVEAYREEIVRQKERDFTTEKQDKINTQELGIFNCETNIDTYKKQLKINKESYEKTASEIEEIEQRLSNGTLLEQEAVDALNRKEEEVDSARKALREIEDKMAEGRRLLMGKVTCPQCEYEFISTDTTKDLKKVSSGMEALDTMSRENSSKINESSEEIRGLRQKKQEISTLKQKLERIVSDLKDRREDFKRNISSIENHIDNLNATINNHKQIIETIGKSESDAEEKIKQTQTLLEQSISIVDSHREELEKLSKDRDKQQELELQFNKFKTRLVNKTVKVIEFYCNRVLSKMNSCLSVNIEGYREKRGGKGLIEKITTTVHKEGFPCGNFGRFSSGERGRIEVANILSLQSLINSSSPSGGFNILFLDEIIESIDSEGITGIVTELDNSMNKPIFVVTHATYEGTYERVMRVTKSEKNVSTIEYVNIHE